MGQAVLLSVLPGAAQTLYQRVARVHLSKPLTDAGCTAARPDLHGCDVTFLHRTPSLLQVTPPLVVALLTEHAHLQPPYLPARNPSQKHCPPVTPTSHDLTTHLWRDPPTPAQCAAAQGPGPGSASEGSGPSGKHWPRGGGKRDGAKKARTPGLYEVRVVTPPPRSLGIYALPPNTACGEEIDVEGSSYVVTTVVLQYKLRGGKYVR